MEKRPDILSTILDTDTMMEREPVADFEPVIVALCCHFCAFAAADLAGSMRMEYPANVRIVRFPCTGKVDVIHMLKAFEEGADGVFVAGCLEGNCHFEKGNLYAKRRVYRAKKLIAAAGLEPERLEMFNLSSAEGPRFAAIARQMTERVKRIGPSPVRPKPQNSI